MRKTHFVLIFLTVIFYLANSTTASAAESMSRLSQYQESPKNFGLDLTYSSLKYPNYNYSTTTNFLVNGAGHSGALTFEWMPIQNYGKLGVGFSAGFFVLSNVKIAEDTFATLYTYPLQLFLSYRFDYFEKQVLVPYIRVGAEMTPVKQASKTGADRGGLQNYYGTNLAAGIELLLNVFEPASAKNLDESTGINSTYLVCEYEMGRVLKAGQNPDLSHNAIRFGLRFEF